jgi:hypothetical protein
MASEADKPFPMPREVPRITTRAVLPDDFAQRVMSQTVEHPLDRIRDMIANLKYVDMMEFSKGLVRLGVPDTEHPVALTTPEAYAALLYSWSIIHHD